MTDFNYARTRATAERLIAKFGMTATLEKPGAATGDPWNPTPGTPTTSTITVVQGFERLRDRDGTLVGQTLHTLTISTDGGAVPAKADRVQVQGEWFEIIEVRPTSPGGVDVMYKVDVRNG